MGLFPDARSAGDDGVTAQTMTGAISAPRPQGPPPPATDGSPPAPVSAGGQALEDSGFLARYQQRAVLASGGMGEVRLCHDSRIDREVAMKVIREERGFHDDARMRFLREARIQGQLEHPAVVPVYDLGLGPRGEIFFTMKRIRGVSLKEILDRLRRGDPEAAATYTRHRLLTVFSSVCLAVDFAHQRGVLHRDLKPANLMLGDFGEVHVLDWGLARIAGDSQAEASLQMPRSESVHTVAGRIMGTPGYMSPEQARGALDELSPRSDVYALGAILFEVLTLHPLHRGQDSGELLRSTLSGAEARPSLRCRDAEVAPELEALCAQATALSPTDRPPTARVLHEAVERFLAGDRDLALRRELARAHAERAAERAAAALAGGAAAEEARSAALQELGRALALDPQDPAAARTFIELLTRPPAQVPAEAQAELARSSEAAHRRSQQAGGLMMLSLLPLLPFALWMGVRDWPRMAVLSLLALGLAVHGLVNARAQRVRRYLQCLMPCGVFVGLILMSRVAGVYLIVPALSIMGAVALAYQPARWIRVLGIAGCAAAMSATAALESLGVLRPSCEFVSGTLLIRPQLLDLPKIPTRVSLLLFHVVVVLACGLYVSYLRSALERSERRFQVQHWHLRQLLPGTARQAVSTLAAEMRQE
jgi:serine/threonine-protein kinase